MTTNANYQRLFNEIKTDIPGAVDAVIYLNLWRVMKDFLDQTNIWKEDVPFPVLPNTFNYTITPVGKGVINRLMVVFDPNNVVPPDRRWVVGGISFVPPGDLALTYSPSTGTTWVATVAKSITDADVVTSTNPEPTPVLDDNAYWIVDKYRDAFRYGTLGYLFMSAAKPYSNTKLGAQQWQNYMSARNRARNDALHANVYNGQRWSFPQGFATVGGRGWV